MRCQSSGRFTCSGGGGLGITCTLIVDSIMVVVWRMVVVMLLVIVVVWNATVALGMLVGSAVVALGILV